MYKKRIASWGISKNVKADKKEDAIATLLHEVPSTAKPVPIRLDKLVRHAKARPKSGEMGGRDLSEVVKQRAHNEIRQLPLKYHATRSAAKANPSHPINEAAFLQRSLTPPDAYAGPDLFFRAMRVLIEKEGEEWRIGQKVPPNAIYDPLTKGIAQWRAGRHAPARKSFGQAAHKMIEDIRGPAVSVSRITYCISSMQWGPRREPVFEVFAQFMLNAALEVLGQNCPMTIALQYLQSAHSIDAQLAIWTCAMDDYQISTQNIDLWWDMARRRWRWCQQSGLTDLAARYCNAALSEARQIASLTNGMELEARRDLESSALAERADWEPPP